MIKVYTIPDIEIKKLLYHKRFTSILGSLFSFKIFEYRCIIVEDNDTSIFLSSEERPLKLNFGSEVDLEDFYGKLMSYSWETEFKTRRIINSVSSSSFLLKVMKFISPEMNCVVSIKSYYDYLTKIIGDEVENLPDLEE